MQNGDMVVLCNAINKFTDLQQYGHRDNRVLPDIMLKAKFSANFLVNHVVDSSLQYANNKPTA